MARRTVGIDFGTSTTLIAVREGELPPRILPLGDVTTWMPSVLGHDGSELIAGESAVRLGPSRSLRSIKSLLTKGEEFTQIGDETISLRDGIKALVTEAVRRAEAQYPKLFEGADVFVGCPALWTGNERKTLVDALHECGLKVDIGEVIDEPVAAGLHWVHDQWQRTGARVSGRSLIFDAGGGTLDVGYLDVAGIDTPSMTILSSEGRGESGDALDESIAGAFLEQMTSAPKDPVFMTLLVEAARDLKEQLSSVDMASARLPAPFDTDLKLTRNDLEEIFKDQLSRARSLTKSALGGSLLRVAQPLSPVEIRTKLKEWTALAAEVDHVALVGGLAHIPIVRSSLEEMFPRSQVVLVDRPQESVARGLTYGDRLDELNLPRPPIDFYVTIKNSESSGSSSSEDQQLLYRAFSPLYTPAELSLGKDKLGWEREVWVPAEVRGRSEVTIRCVMPTRKRETLTLRFNNNGTTQTGTGISLWHSGSGPIRFKLYTNGEFVVTSSGNRVMARIDRWPTLRGAGHNYQREIELMSVGYDGPSQLAQDDWRFN